MSLYWFPLPLDFLLHKILALATSKIHTEGPTMLLIMLGLHQTQVLPMLGVKIQTAIGVC